MYNQSKNIFRISIYWQCQLIGWSLAGLFWAYQGMIESVAKSYWQALIHFIGDCIIGIMLTHGYRYIALQNNWHTHTPRFLIWRIIPSIFVLGILFMILIALKLYVIRLYFSEGFLISFGKYLAANWLTLWITGTRLMAVWVLAFHMYQYARYRIQMAEENARLMILTKQTQLNNLSAQLNPHFFFNSLNNIKFLVIENPQAARRAIDLLSDLLRMSLYQTEGQLISLKEELNLVRDYLELEKLRFEQRLQLQTCVQEETYTTLIPLFSIQTLVENAIKHGVSNQKEGGLIEINIEKQPHQIKISVESPGKLTIQQPGLGLNNLKERLQLQFNGKAAFEIVALENERVLATIIISIV